MLGGAGDCDKNKEKYRVEYIRKIKLNEEERLTFERAQNIIDKFCKDIRDYGSCSDCPFCNACWYDGNGANFVKNILTASED